MAAGAGHWITLHPHGEEEEGTVHVFIGGGGGKDAGRITKGPKGLIGASMAHLAGHARAEHHKPGHEPAGAKSHPDYHEHQPRRTIHVYGRHGPGVGYEVETDNPLPEHDEESAKKALGEARDALKSAQQPEQPAAPAPAVGAAHAALAGRAGSELSDRQDRATAHNVLDHLRQAGATVGGPRSAAAVAAHQQAAREGAASLLRSAESTGNEQERAYARDLHAHVHGTRAPAAPAPPAPVQTTAHGELAGQTELPGVPQSTQQAPAQQMGFLGMPEHQAPPPKQQAQLPGQQGMFQPAMGGSALVARQEAIAPPASAPAQAPPPEPPKGAYRPTQEEHAHLGRIADLQQRHDQLRDIVDATPRYGQSNRLEAQRQSDEAMRVDRRLQAERGALADKQYARMHSEAKFTMEPHLDHEGHVNVASAGHADPAIVNHLLSTYRKLPEHRQDQYVAALAEAAWHHDPMAANAPRHAAMNYATALSHIYHAEMPETGEPETHTIPPAHAAEDLAGGHTPMPEAPVQHADHGQYRGIKQFSASRGEHQLHIVEESPGAGKYRIEHDSSAPGTPRRTDVYGRGLDLRTARKHAASVLSSALGTSGGRFVLPREAPQREARPQTGFSKEVHMAEDSSRGGYLVTEPDGTTHLPTKKNGSYDRGLAGAAWAALHGGYRGQKYQGPDKSRAISRLKAIYARMGWELPGGDGDGGDAEHSRTAGMVAARTTAFALTAGLGDEDGYVLRRGKIFEAGDFPDKGYFATPEDLEDAVKAFMPCPVDLEHIETPLSGKLGEVRSIALGDDGWSLYGTVALPTWLDSALEGTARGVSATWDRQTKCLKGLALTLEPRVPDAVLLSAHAAFAARRSTEGGRRALQDVHDLASQHGAVCRDRSVHLRSAHEHNALQHIHDHAVEHGAQCSFMDKEDKGKDGPPARDEARHSATVPVAGRVRMSNWRKWFTMGPDGRALARDAGAQIAEEEVFEAAADMADYGKEERASEQLATMSRELEAARREARQARLARLESEAAGYVDGLISGGKLFPAEREATIADYVGAGTDDAEHGSVHFADGTGGSRVERLRARLEARPSHGLYGEQLKTTGRPMPVPAAELEKLRAAGYTVTFNQTTTPGMDGTPAYDPDDLLRMTPAGKAALAAKNGKGGSN